MCQFVVTDVAVVIGGVVIVVVICMVFAVALDKFHFFSKLIDHGF